MIDFSLSDFKKLLLEKFIFCFATFNLTIGLFNIYGNIAILLEHKENDPELRTPTSIAGIWLQISVIILIILSSYSKKTNEKAIYKSTIENPEILYLICAPSIIINIILLSVTLLKDTALYFSKKSNEVNSTLFEKAIPLSFDSVTIVYYVTLLIFLFQHIGLHDFGENWNITLLNLTTILFIMISQLYFIAFYVFITNTQSFLSLLSDKTIQNPCDNVTTGIPKTFCDLWKNERQYLTISIIISGFSCIIFLLKHFLLHYENLQRLKTETVSSSNNYVENENGKIYTESFLLSLVVGVLLVIVLLLLIFKKTNIFIYYGVETIIYLLMLVASGFFINMIKDWPHQDHEKREIFNQILVWTGLFGQILQILAMITYVFNDKKYRIITVKCSIQLIQNIVQSILESIFLEKQMKLPKIENNFLLITSVVFLTIINMLFGLITIFTSYSFLFSLDNQFPFNLFSFLLYRTGMIFSISQRIHGGFLFFTYIRYIAKRYKIK